MARLLLEDITVSRTEFVTLQIHFKGGAHRTIQLPLPLRSWEQRQTSKEAVAEIDRLLNHKNYSAIAADRNDRGMVSGEGKPFTARVVARFQRSYNLKSRYDRLCDAGMLTVREMAELLGICGQRVTLWKRHGLIRGHAYNAKNDCLYEHPGDSLPPKAHGVKLSTRPLVENVAVQRSADMPCEA